MCDLRNLTKPNYYKVVLVLRRDGGMYMQQIKLMVPGPTPLPPKVIEELAKPMIHHRGCEFTKITFEVIELLKQFFHTIDQDVLIIPSSGRGAMEAAIVNSFSRSDKILAVSNGYFGEVFATIGESYELNIVKAKFDWEETIDFNIVEKLLETESDIKGILYTHCETSSGIENDLKTIGNLAKKYNKLLLVDTVSSFGCMPINVDKLNIDIAVSASQKGLMSPTGISIVTISKKAWHAIEHSDLPKYYFDFRLMKGYMDKGQTHVSTPVPLVRALNASLKLIYKEGLENVFNRHKTLANYIRDEAIKLGYSLYPNNLFINRANSLSAFLLPPQLKSDIYVNYALKNYKTLFSKGLGKTSSYVLRVGHMGWFHEKDAIHMVKVLKDTKQGLDF